MTDNEIIKALECCCSPKVNACDDCPFHKRCYENNEWLEKEAIDLINRQKAEIERLTAFKSYFDELYGKGLDIANWHKNGDLEPFDSFYNSALEEMEGDTK